MEQLEQGKSNPDANLSQLKTPRERDTNVAITQNKQSYRSKTLISSTQIQPSKSSEQKGQFVISYNFDHTNNFGSITRNIFIGWDDQPYKRPIKKLNVVKNTNTSKTAPKNKLPLLNNIIDQSEQKQNLPAALTKRKSPNSLTKTKITPKQNDPLIQNHPYTRSKQCSLYKDNTRISNKIFDQTTLKHGHMPVIGGSGVRGNQNIELISNRNTINNNTKFRNSSVNSLKPIENPIQKTARISQYQSHNNNNRKQDRKLEHDNNIKQTNSESKVDGYREVSRHKPSSFSNNHNKDKGGNFQKCAQGQSYSNGRTIQHKSIPKISNRNQILQSSFSKPKGTNSSINQNANTNTNNQKQNSKNLNKVNQPLQKNLEQQQQINKDNQKDSNLHVENEKRNNKKIFNKTVDQLLFSKQQQNQQEQERIEGRINERHQQSQLEQAQKQQKQHIDQKNHKNQVKLKDKKFLNEDDDNFCDYGANTLKLIEDLEKMQSEQTPRNNSKNPTSLENQTQVQLSLQKKCQKNQQTINKTENNSQKHEIIEETKIKINVNEKKQINEKYNVKNNETKNNQSKEQRQKQQRRGFGKKQQKSDQSITIKPTTLKSPKFQQKIKQKSTNLTLHKDSIIKDKATQNKSNQPKSFLPKPQSNNLKPEKLSSQNKMSQTATISKKQKSDKQKVQKSNITNRKQNSQNDNIDKNENKYVESNHINDSKGIVQINPKNENQLTKNKNTSQKCMESCNIKQNIQRKLQNDHLIQLKVNQNSIMEQQIKNKNSIENNQINEQIKVQNAHKFDIARHQQQKIDQQKTVTTIKSNQNQKANQQQQQQNHIQNQKQTKINLNKQQNNRIIETKQKDVQRQPIKQNTFHKQKQTKISSHKIVGQQKPKTRQSNKHTNRSIKKESRKFNQQRKQISQTKPQFKQINKNNEEAKIVQIGIQNQQPRDQSSHEHLNNEETEQNKKPVQKYQQAIIQQQQQKKPNSGAAIHRKRQSNKSNIKDHDNNKLDQYNQQNNQNNIESIKKAKAIQIDQNSQQIQQKIEKNTTKQISFKQSETKNGMKSISQQSKRSQHSLGQSIKRNNRGRDEDKSHKTQIVSNNNNKHRSINKSNSNTNQQGNINKNQQPTLQNQSKLKEDTTSQLQSSSQSQPYPKIIVSSSQPKHDPSSLSNLADSDSELEATPPITNPTVPRQLTCISKNSSKMSLTGRAPSQITSRAVSNQTVTSRSEKVSEHKPIKIKQYRHASVQMTEKEIGKDHQREDVGVGNDGNYHGNYEGINVSVGTSVKEVKETGIENKMDMQLIQYREQQQQNHNGNNVQNVIKQNTNQDQNPKTNSLIRSLDQQSRLNQRRFNQNADAQPKQQQQLQQQDNIVSFANISCAPKISLTKKQSFLDVSNVDNLNHTDFPALNPIKQRKFNSSQCSFQHAPIVSFVYGDELSQIQSSLTSVSPLSEQSPFVQFSTLQSQSCKSKLVSQSPSLSSIFRAIYLIYSMNPSWLTRIIEPYLSIEGEHQVWLHVRGKWALYRSNHVIVGAFDVVLAGIIEKIYYEQEQGLKRKGITQKIEIEIQDVIAMITGFRVMQLKNKKKLSQQIEYHLKKGNLIKGISSDSNKQSYTITAVETTAKNQKLIQIELSPRFESQQNHKKDSDRILWIKQETFQKYFDYFLLICQQKDSFWTAKDIKISNIKLKEDDDKKDQTNWGQTLVYTLDSIEKAVGVIEVHVQHPCICKMDLYRQIKPKILKFLGTLNQPSKFHTSLSNSNISFNFNLSGRYYLLIKFNQNPSQLSSQSQSPFETSHCYPYFSLCSSSKITVSYLESIQPQTYKNSTSQYIQISNNVNNTKTGIMKSKKNINSLHKKSQIKKMFVDYLMGKGQLSDNDAKEKEKQKQRPQREIS